MDCEFLLNRTGANTILILMCAKKEVKIVPYLIQGVGSVLDEKNTG
jgi:hypothetical protein